MTAQQQQLNITQCIDKINRANRTQTTIDYMGSNVPGSDYTTCKITGAPCPHASNRATFPQLNYSRFGCSPFSLLPPNCPSDLTTPGTIPWSYSSPSAPSVRLLFLDVDGLELETHPAPARPCRCPSPFPIELYRGTGDTRAQYPHLRGPQMSHQQPFQIDDRLSEP
jgi:hypothetical protein